MVDTKLWIYILFGTLVITTNTSPPPPPPPPSCGLYGQPPCQFLPAPPGCTPSCARGGHTYCTKVKEYPRHVINHLLKRFDYRGLFADETFDDLYSYTHLEFPHSFDPPVFNIPITERPIEGGYTYGPKTHYGESSQYSHATNNNRQSHINYVFKPLKPSHSQYTHHHGNQYHTHDRSLRYDFPYQQHNNLTYRYRRSVKSKKVKKQSEKLNLLSNATSNAPSNHLNRSKRQISFGREQLCQVTTQFVMPQAALNSRGNWMYVVNQENQPTQLVKTEVCASRICSNLCQLPNAYNSRCEQKYVQKRLVALEASGQRLYTDTFWFPSCCVCTLSNQ